MTFKLKRYTFNKHLLAEGNLTVIHNGALIELTYTDEFITELSAAPFHPIAALEGLRLKLEVKHESLLSCMGCRIDTTYRPTGGYGTYLIAYGEPATQQTNIFESTAALEKLTTVEKHKAAYKLWCDYFSKQS